MLTQYKAYSDPLLVELLTQRSDETAFAEIYRRYGRELISEANRKTGDRSLAEDIVQEIFVKLWMRRSRLAIDKNIQAYLKGMLKYHVIDYYANSHKSPVVPAANITLLPEPEENDYISINFVQSHYQAALLKLPQKCREVFVLSRSGHSTREIAISLGISEKTVEVHIGKALRFLRVEMKDYIALAVLFLK